MVIEDHINLMNGNPLIGINDDSLGPRFPDLCAPYDATLIDAALEIGRKENFAAHKGVYVAVTGPNLETRARIPFSSWYRSGTSSACRPFRKCLSPFTPQCACWGLSVITDMCPAGRAGAGRNRNHLENGRHAPNRSSARSYLEFSNELPPSHDRITSRERKPSKDHCRYRSRSGRPRPSPAGVVFRRSFSPRGKTVEAMTGIFQIVCSTMSKKVLATRLCAEYAARFKTSVSKTHNTTTSRERYGFVPRVFSPSHSSARWPSLPPEQVISRLPKRAIETLSWCGVKTVFIQDVGVAGPHRPDGQSFPFRRRRRRDRHRRNGRSPSKRDWRPRLPARSSRCQRASATEPAFKESRPLLGMLNSCASNVTVVNIDAGFKAGYVAALIAKRAND